MSRAQIEKAIDQIEEQDDPPINTRRTTRSDMATPAEDVDVIANMVGTFLKESGMEVSVHPGETSYEIAVVTPAQNEILLSVRPTLPLVR